MTNLRRVAFGFVLAIVTVAIATTAERKFYDDDPLMRVPESQDASGAAPRDIGLLYDLGYNLFVTATRSPRGTRAGNVNTIDEVPDSSWFTNRIGMRDVSIDEAVRGPNAGPPPAPASWTIIRPKTSGFAPGFTARDADGETWFVSFDAPSNPEGATGAILVATKLFWALGYNQVENFVSTVSSDHVTIDPGATIRRPSMKRTPMTRADLGEIFERSAKNADGSYRIAAGRLLPGKILGGFSYMGTRPDDPNDLVPHEDRRELRALRVFGAWTNLTDMKAGNTLDTVVEQDGRHIIRHYLQDVGSTFGMGANGPHDADEGYEYLYEGGQTWRRIRSFGLARSPWQKVKYEKYDAVGPFEGDTFDPPGWRPRVPPASFINMRDDDAFWAARRVMAFSDDLIRAIVKTGQFSDPKAEQYLADVLIKRRDKVGRSYLTKINPIVDPALDAAGRLTFGNAAIQYRFADAPASYKAVWYTFDNATGESNRIGETESREPRMQAPTGLPGTVGQYIRLDLSAVDAKQPAWATPIEVYFRKFETGWKLVGLERLPANTSTKASKSE
jgi:hypothetical protein